jgi:tripartite ATP-independent transporter DctM subunit
MIIYGSFMGVSIAGLFAAGLIPGLLMAPLLMILTYRTAKKENYPKAKKRASFSEIFESVRSSSLALLMPIIILGGILTGFFTPTEAGAVAVVYGLLIGVFVYRNFKIRDLGDVLVKMTHTTSIVFLILATAGVLSWLLASEQIPRKVVNLVFSITTDKYLILLFMNLLLLLVGCFMDQTAALIVLGPILAPLSINIGVHPLHFGIIMCLNLVIGLTTPPLGVCLFSCCSIAGISIEDITKPIWPMILYLLAVLMLVTYVPAVSMTLPTLLGYS